MESRITKMSIGYACLTVGVPQTKISTTIQKNATEERLKELISYNLGSLENMIDFNIENNIFLYRISSGLIPFGSSPVNQLDWSSLYKEDFQRIGKKIHAHKMRVSFHPGQYTVLNSPTPDVVERAIEDLDYHVKVLEALGMDSSHKVILHIGGVYGDKESAIQRFIATYEILEQRIKDRLIIENDDRLYTIEDVLRISHHCSIPVVYDNLHHAINPPSWERTDAYWIKQAASTWKEKDGRQKIHYSQQALDKRAGAHTATIHLAPFLDFYQQVSGSEIDIMLEVKDKNLSAVKCILATEDDIKIQKMEHEWARYKYALLEKSPVLYQQVRELLKDKNPKTALPFYEIIEQVYTLPENMGYSENAALHVWGYFKNMATEKEEQTFRKRLEKYREGTLSLAALKRYLWKLTEKYQVNYLLQSLYFSF